MYRGALGVVVVLSCFTWGPLGSRTNPLYKDYCYNSTAILNFGHVTSTRLCYTFRSYLHLKKSSLLTLKVIY
jgi:hypothetical protein